MVSECAGQMGAAPANRSPSLSNLPCGSLTVGCKAVIDNAVAQIGSNNATLSAGIDRPLEPLHATGANPAPHAPAHALQRPPRPDSAAQAPPPSSRQGAAMREGETCGRSVGAILPDPAQTQQSNAWRMARVRGIVETAAPAPNRLRDAREAVLIVRRGMHRSGA
jgi:hypothetical protein